MDDWSIELTDTPIATESGDLDGNGWVDDADLTILKNAWGDSVVPLSQPDPSGDGWVGGADFDIVMKYWHWSAPTAGSSSVPEPGSLALLVLGSLVLLARRRRCRVC